MKRITTISLLLIANLILLAQAVIPHHHHRADDICFVQHEEGCPLHEHDENGLPIACTHQHNDNSSCTCAINQQTILSSERKEVKCECGHDHADKGEHQFLAQLPDDIQLSEKWIFSTSFRHKPYFTHYISAQPGQFKALRAPPVIA